ncbi:Ubiquitin carboxyl-terminal hydrolase [Thalictrum thalictroides]|uniref:Ubiquitin carboxyl-terminal hydrolase n=1 Tax=Thalictrum thalictroides TaxID=46969 RepID=A0A7J6UUL5_THATH|nr:Ubiquitin carboxyl-terminal hydrolase [Thalictrum thalictroides]
MSERLTCVTEMKKPSDGCSSSESIFQKRIEFPSTSKHSPVFSNGYSENFPLENLNPNSNYSQKSNSNGRVLSSLMEKNQCGDGLDPELSFRTTFRRIGAGLANLGNTCFLNSVLQCLTYTEPFAAYLQSGKHKSSCHISGFCALCAIQKHVRQEDAHEYMVNLLESMHKCCLPSGFASESPGAYEKSLVHKIFGGLLRSQVRCMECSYGSNKYDPFLDLSLEIANADSLHDALLDFTGVEQLDGGERHYQCQHCKQKVKAERQLTIHKAPYVLSIHLKRFGSLIPGQKINKKVKFSPTLDLKQFSSCTYEGGLRYTLYGVLVHAGWSTHSGHYYCYVRTSSGTWYLLDDDEIPFPIGMSFLRNLQVFEVCETDVLKQRAYMLFYVRDRRNHAPKKPVDMLTKGSSIPVSSPILTKSNTVPSDSMKESISKNPSVLTSQGSLMEGSAVAIGSLESSFKNVFDVCSIQHSSINHMRGESLPCINSVVEGGGTFSHPSSASSYPKTETKVINSHITSEGLPVIDSSVVKTQGSMSHPPGAKSNNICEDNGTIKDLTGSVATLSDCNVQEFCSTATDMEDENASLIEMESDKEASKVSGLGSDEVDLMQLSSQSGTEVSLCKKLSDAILSHPTGVKAEEKFVHKEIIKSSPVAAFPDCNTLQLIASKTSATDMEEGTSVIAMETSTAVSKEVSELRSDEVDSMRLSSLSGTEESLSKASGLTISVDKRNNIMSLPIDKTAEDINEQKETMNHLTWPSCQTPCLSGTEESLSKGSGLTISVDKRNNIMSLPIDKTAEDINEQKETMNDLTWSSCHTPCLSGTEGSSSNASELIIPVGQNDTIMSHPMEKTAEDINEQKETINDLTGPVATLPGCNVSTTSAIDMEHEKASVIEMEPKKTLSIELNKLGFDEVDLVQLSNQSGIKKSLCKKVNFLGPEIVGLVPFLSQYGTENVVCQSVRDFGPEEVDSRILSQSDSEEAICKGVSDFGPGEVISMQVSNQLGTENAVCQSIRDFRPGEVDSRPEEFDSRILSQSDTKEVICKGVNDFGPGEVISMQVSNQLGTENAVCQSIKDFRPEEVDSRILSQSDAEEVIYKGVSDFGPGEVISMQVSDQLGTENAVCQNIRDFRPEEVDSRILSQSDAAEAICKGVSDFVPVEVNLMQVSNQLGTEELCKSVSNLGSGEVGSKTLFGRQNTEYDENGDILNERSTSYQQNTEENGHTSVETMSVDTLIQSSMISRRDQKEGLNHLHCQKVLKPTKYLKKFQVASIRLSSSLFFREPSWIRRKKKNKKSKKRSLEGSKSIPNKIGENFISGLEPSTSEQTRTVAFDSSLSQRQKGSSGASKIHCRKTKRNDSYGDSSTKLVQVEFRERSGLNGGVLAMHEAPVKRSCSALASNCCHYKESDSSQERRSSVNDFMSMLTRGLEETTVSCWEEIDSHPSESLGSNKGQSTCMGYVSDDWNMEYDREKRKKVRGTKNSSSGRNAFQELATMKKRLKKAKMDQSSSGNRPFRI